VVDCNEQINVGPPIAKTVGNGFTISVTVFTSTQLAFDLVTVYDVVVVGLTTIEDVV
jgi:hypothetical protein